MFHQHRNRAPLVVEGEIPKEVVSDGSSSREETFTRFHAKAILMINKEKKDTKKKEKKKKDTQKEKKKSAEQEGQRERKLSLEVKENQSENVIIGNEVSRDESEVEEEDEEKEIVSRKEEMSKNKVKRKIIVGKKG